MDYRLELVLIPVSDVDRAKAFYVDMAGFNLDVDFSAGVDFRVVQMTPPGSACSISVGKGITDSAPGAVKGTHLVVRDIEAARAELVGRGVEVSEIRHMDEGQWARGQTRSTVTTRRSPTSATRTETPGCCRKLGSASRSNDLVRVVRGLLDRAGIGCTTPGKHAYLERLLPSL